MAFERGWDAILGDTILCCLAGTTARSSASRRLLLQGAELGDPNPVCQFCEVAVSYVKVPPLHRPCCMHSP